MSRRKWVVELITQIVKDVPTAEMVVDRLMEEGVLHLGYGDAEVDAVVSKFTEVFGTTRTSQADRWAAHRLVKRYGSQAVVGIIQLLGSLSHERYAPVVGSIMQLEDKWVSVMNFLRKNREEEIIDV